MSVESVKPFRELSAAEFREMLDDIFRRTPPANLASLLPPLQKSSQSAKAQLASAEEELKSFSLTGDVEPAQLAALKEIFEQSLRAAVVAAENKVFVADRALDYVTTQTSRGAQ